MSQLIDAIGFVGAAVTTLCSIPQVMKILRDKEARALSLVSTLGLAFGGTLWLTYGILRFDWVLITSTGISLPVTLLILALKLRYG
jgi:MtN3 and saliva related transmembrane protein